MKNTPFKPLLFFIAISQIFSGCSTEKLEESIPEVSKNENACFTIPAEDLYAEVSVNFDAGCSTASSQYNWDFGDANISTGKEVSHTYKEEGEYKVVLKTIDENGKEEITAKTITVLPSPWIKHDCTDIEGDVVWEEGWHLIKCDVEILGTLTIKPGAELFFEEETSLEVKGKLIAQGTAEKNIIFKPVATDNAYTEPTWGYIHFNTTTDESILEYCNIINGGKEDKWDYPDWDYYSKFGVIHIDNCTVSINNTIIEGAANYGITFNGEAGLKSFENNIFRNNANYSIEMNPNRVHTISATNDFTGDKGLYIPAFSSINVGGEIQWPNHSVPYIMEVGFTLENNTKLDIEPGTVFKFDHAIVHNTNSIEVTNGSELTAIGTSTNPIVFTSLQEDPQPGDWMGIEVAEGGKGTFEFCEMEYAGATSNRSHSVFETNSVFTSFNNCTIRYSEGMGVDLGEEPLSFKNNTIENSQTFGITIGSPQALRKLDQSNTITGSEDICLRLGKEFTSDVTIPFINNWVYVCWGIAIQNNHVLTIEPGVELQFRFGGGIDMLYKSSGQLVAKGTSERPIRFTRYAKDIPDHGENWGSIVFGESTTTTSVLEYCIIDRAGADPIDPYYGAIHCDYTNGAPIISNTTIQNSASYGVSKISSTPIINNVTYINNAKADEVDL